MSEKQENIQLKQELEELYENVRSKMNVIQSLNFKIDELKKKLIEKDKEIDNLIYDQYPEQLKKTLCDLQNQSDQEKLNRLKFDLFLHEELLPLILNLTNWAENQETNYKFDEGDSYHHEDREKTHVIRKKLDNFKSIIKERA